MTGVCEEFVRRIPRDFAREHLIAVMVERSDRLCGATLHTATDDPAVLHNVQVRVGRRMPIVRDDPESIARLLDDAYGAGSPVDSPATTDEPADAHADLERLVAQAERDLLTSTGKGPVVRLVDALLFDALAQGASDLHVQPLEDRWLVRYRVDGLLLNVRELPMRLAPAVLSRIKVMGRMDIAESRIPQDGRATVTVSEQPIDLRISTLPTSHGERAVLRLLDHRRELTAFKDLGMPDDVAARFLKCARLSHGMVLLTGPTGSGKTTTLYATLKEISTPTTNVMTVEDPVEYELSTIGLLVSQAAVNEKKGVTFATGLRHILRQDPDIVMVGEIRDAETARTAIQASLTGHLVFSTLHTNDSASAVTRLTDLGVPRYLVASSLSAVCAQRLVRLSHEECRGEGCEACFGTGFAGRTALFELLVLDETLTDLVASDAPLAALRAAAKERGMRTLKEEGRRLVERGLTTWAEVERVATGGGDRTDSAEIAGGAP